MGSETITIIAVFSAIAWDELLRNVLRKLKCIVFAVSSVPSEDVFEVRACAAVMDELINKIAAHGCSIRIASLIASQKTYRNT